MTSCSELGEPRAGGRRPGGRTDANAAIAGDDGKDGERSTGPEAGGRDLGMLPGPASPWRAGDPRRRVPRAKETASRPNGAGVLLGGPPAGRRDPVPLGCVRQPSRRDGRPRHDSPGPERQK